MEPTPIIRDLTIHPFSKTSGKSEGPGMLNFQFDKKAT